MRSKKQKLTRLQRQYAGGTLCPDHAAAYDMPQGTYTACVPTEDLGDEDPIVCDCCNMRAMRETGAV